MDLGNLIKDVVGNSGAAAGDQNQQQQVAGGLLEMINNHGGIGGFADKLRSAGLGQQVDSWISSGQNQAVSPQQVQQGLGQEQVQELAQKAGINPVVASTIAAAVLPMIIDRLTPNGQVPQGNAASAIGGILGGMFNRK